MLRISDGSVASLVALVITHFNVWKHGVPNIFIGSDVLVSWNVWATIWSQGNFPVSSYGYPQLIPTLWAVTYIFTGSPEQYFAFYIYIGLIMGGLAADVADQTRKTPAQSRTRFVGHRQLPWIHAAALQN